ncbi:MAG: molybdopterin-guanine dinucleotide biosynthesis protein A [Tagaea sp.]
MRAALAVLALIVAGSAAAQQPPSPARINDRHAGYYYPPPVSRETYVSRARTLIEMDRTKRLDFVNGLTNAQLSLPYRAGYAIFAKGDPADRLIITAMERGQLDTVFRARALLAQLTSAARTSPFFEEVGVEDLFTFLDLLKFMGFTRLTIGDGDKFAHQINIR